LLHGHQIYFHINRNDSSFLRTSLLVALWNVPGRGNGVSLKGEIPFQLACLYENAKVTHPYNSRPEERVFPTALQYIEQHGEIIPVSLV
jgi:hypothetical protein